MVKVKNKKPVELTYVKFDNPYVSNVSKVSWLQRAILIHSCLYYRYNKSIISDEKYDLICKQLSDMQKELTESELKDTEYYQAFYDFDGSTGFHLLSRLDVEQLELIEIIASHAPQKLK